MSNAVVTGVQPVDPNLADAKQSDSDRQSNQHESEYDTASDSPSDDDDLQSGEYDDEIHSSEEDELHSDLGGGDEEEEEDEDEDGENAEGAEGEAVEGEEGEKKKVDDDEDRSNPQYIPKKGTFYEHDDRTAENPLAKPSEEAPEPSVDSAENASSTVSPLPVKPVPKKAFGGGGGGDKWSHDRFDMSEQAPKSRQELVSAYGYDIRSEDAPPKVKRSKHYGRGPTKYDRNWEDENAYGKQVVAKRVNSRAVPKGEDFPRLNERRPKRSSGPPRDELSTAEGSEDGAGVGGRSYNNHSNNNRDNNNRDRNRRQGRESGGGGDRDRGERGFRGNEKSREFKNRNHSGRSMGGRDTRDSGRPSYRRSGDGPGDRDRDRDQEREQPFNGMSFTNSNLSHGKRAEQSTNDPRHVRPVTSGGVGDMDRETAGDSMPQRAVPRSGGYGSGRLQRRDDKPPAAQPHFQQQQQHHSQQHSGVELTGSVGTLPLHATPAMATQQQMPKRYSEKRQGMRGASEQQSQPTNVQQVLQSGPGGMMDPQLEHLHGTVVQQQQQQQQQHLGVGPPPPFMSNRAYVQMDAGPPMMQQQPQQQQQQPPQGQPIPAQYANYYPTEYLPQTAPTQPANAQQGMTVVPGPAAFPAQYMGQGAAVPQTQQQQQQPLPPVQQAPVVAGNGAQSGQSQLINYVNSMQTAPQQSQNPAQYSQYPGYQNYAAMPIQAAPAASNVAYYAPAAQSQQPPQPQQPPQQQPQPPPQQQRAPLPQRRPTNAIPIMAPPDRNATAAGGKGRGRLANEMVGGGGDAEGKAGDDIDHILDNMFVRRPQQPSTSSAARSKTGEELEKTPGGGLDEGMKDLRLNADAGDSQTLDGTRTEGNES